MANINRIRKFGIEWFKFGDELDLIMEYGNPRCITYSYLNDKYWIYLVDDSSSATEIQEDEVIKLINKYLKLKNFI